MNSTKNSQSFEDVKKICAKAFPHKILKNINELAGGLCNSVYRLTFNDNSNVILKIAASTDDGYLSNESNLMEVEVQSMQFVYENSKIPVPKVLFYDTDKDVCNASYFLMETVNGVNFAEIAYKTSDIEKEEIYREIGETVLAVSKMKNSVFGIFGQQGYGTMYDFLYALFQNLMRDAKPHEKQLNFCFDWTDLFDNLSADKVYFDEVTEPSLVHWDLWDGNVFVKDGKISGIIDWERTIWADPLMCEQFRKGNMKKEMLSGFGKTEFSDSEKRRILWYDLFVYATMTVEAIYRKYEDDSQDKWVRPLLNESWKDICNIKALFPESVREA